MTGLLFNRALTYGVLVVTIGATYVYGVAHIDALFGLNSDWLAPPQVAAAGLVAVAVHPVRTRLESLADRLVYGRRVTRRQALTQVTALCEASGAGPQALVRLARVIALGLGTGQAAVHLELFDGSQSIHRWPPEAPSPDAVRLLPVTYQGASVGTIAIPAGPGRDPAPQRRAFVDELLAGAGVVLHNAGLTIELGHRLRATEQRAAEIRASRWRIVAAQDGERRELERDLHDGVQPGLTAVRLSIGLVTHLAHSGKFTEARQALARLRTQVDEASAVLHQTLRGLDPPALHEHGITGALRELTDSLDATVDFQTGPPTPPPRFGTGVEAAVYFCCAEALHNAARHSPGAEITVALDQDLKTGRLRFSVTDDGRGFHPGTVSKGSGLQNMIDRVAAAGGVLTITSKPGRGTKIDGVIPIRPAEPAKTALRLPTAEAQTA